MEIKELRRGEWYARVCVSSGANCIALRHSGYGLRILREPPRTGEWDNPYLYGMPLLFPVNRISGGSFSFESREYTFPVNEPKTGCHLHGDLHNAPFTVVSAEKDELLCSITRQARCGFPHDFRIDITYALHDEGLVQRVSIHNLSDENMPCPLGFHTTFDLCGISKERVFVRADVGELIERDERYLPTGRFLERDEITKALNLSDFRTREVFISRHYRAAGQGKMSLYIPNRKLRICYDADQKFGFRLIYNGDSDTYICMEPQNCAVDAVNAPYPCGFAEMPFVPPHGALSFTSEITLETEGE